jgi:hypothetical protein
MCQIKSCLLQLISLNQALLPAQPRSQPPPFLSVKQVQGLNGVGGLHHFANLGRKAKHRDDVGPMTPPALANSGILAIPLLGKQLQVQLGLIFGGCRVNRLEVSTNRTAVFVGDKGDAVSDHVNHTKLHQNLRKVVAMASGKPVRPSIQVINKSCTPRFLRSMD